MTSNITGAVLVLVVVMSLILWTEESLLFILAMVAGLAEEPLEKVELEGDELVAGEATLLSVLWTEATWLVMLVFM